MGQGKGRLRGPSVFSSILKPKVPSRAKPPPFPLSNKTARFMIPVLSSFCVHPRVSCGVLILDDQGLPGNPASHGHPPSPHYLLGKRPILQWDCPFSERDDNAFRDLCRPSRAWGKEVRTYISFSPFSPQNLRGWSQIPVRPANQRRKKSLRRSVLERKLPSLLSLLSRNPQRLTLRNLGMEFPYLS